MTKMIIKNIERSFNAECLCMKESKQHCDFCKEELICNKESLQACIESSELFFKTLKVGRIRGVVNIAGCKNSELKLDPEYIQLIQLLIKSDILVTTSGCAVEELKNAGLMGLDALQWAGDGLTDFCEHLGIVPIFYMDISDSLNFYPLLADHAVADIKELPLAAMTMHHGQKPLSNMPLLKMKDIYGTIFSMEEGPIKTVELIDTHIHDKRLGLDWCDRFHCSMDTYS